MKVVGYDLWPGISRFGYTGVDIFFILSGFILTAVYRDLTANRIGGFLTRRIFRVYPMHLAVLAGMTLLWLDSYLRFGVHDQSQQLRWLPACSLLLQPFLYHRLMWNSVTWSVSVELVCYLLFPIAIYLLRNQRLLVLAPAVLILASADHHVQLTDLYIWGFGAVKRGLVGFGLGMTLRVISERLPRPSAARTTAVELACLAGITVAAAIGQGSFIPLFAALLILCLSYDIGMVAHVLRRRFWFWLGKISFSLYLIHQALIGPMWMRFPATQLPFRHSVAGMVWTLGVIGLSLVLSTLTWLIIEEPFRQIGSRLARRLDPENRPRGLSFREG
jgi:peptidoglycan/LPS O-acetylase OafA/YrhL